MKNLKTTLTAAAGLTLGLFQTADAHTAFVVNATSVPFAGKSYTATLNVGHGCEPESGPYAGIKYDTERLEVTIPAGATSVRPMDAAWADATVETDGTNVTKLIWTKKNAVRAQDTHLYRVSFTVKLPDAPLTAIAFPAVQFCHDGGGAEIPHAWEGVDAPTLKLVPARTPGWNKYTAQAAIDEATIKAFFADAYIVWSGGAAYSANAVTAGLITTPLTTIPAGAEFWVKY